ncbi:PREDICTED: probable G-protein coupled receptor 25, partial [Leptosomus discolor]|uniref:probable G-protein coupled receptor 25 n=1 Tax=Leptosomus discolor TaxID=188344 RepID=UPI000522D9B7
VFSGWEVFFTTVFIPILYSFIFLLGLVGNLFVIVLTAKKSGGKRMVDTFVLNLAVADVIFVCTLPFWVAAGAQGNRWLLGVERYLVIKKVLDTKTMGSRRHIRVTCGVIWAVSLLLGAPSLLYRQLDGDDCWDEDGEDFSLAMVFLTFLLPLGVISFCYCSIYCRLQRHVLLFFLAKGTLVLSQRQEVAL